MAEAIRDALRHFYVRIKAGDEFIRFVFITGISKFTRFGLDMVKKMITDKKIDFIQFEFGGCNIDSKTYFQDFWYLLKDNNRIYHILQDDIYELTTYEETHKIFITINYLAIRK
jgi:hypothetical protein